MYSLENRAEEQGFLHVCGVDEAGRGPLAGPVFAAAVILPKGLDELGLNDSKKLTAKKRDVLFDVIIEKAVSYFIASANEREIDEYNILGATKLAMRRAVSSLSVSSDYALIDGNASPELDISEELVIKGDTKSISIMAASILAKVSRDRYMLKLAEEYPQYALEKHKGYPTELHYERLRQYGISPIHRKSFLKKFIAEG